MPSELTADQQHAIVQVRRDVLASLGKQWPEVAGALYCIAIAGASVEILATANGTGQRLFAEAFNREAMRAGTPWRLVEMAN
jgi:hypothetical protein